MNEFNIAVYIWRLLLTSPQNLELSRATGSRQGEVVSLLNLGTTCELLEQLDKAVEWHTLVCNYTNPQCHVSSIRSFASAEPHTSVCSI